jgi:UDP-GlcNAc:undecaprenyl-phosphate GlcNAc-1-phosphate transferase
MIDALPIGANRAAFFLLAAFVLSAVATRALFRIALRIGLADHPGGRKQHEGTVPVTGGVAMYLGFSVAALAMGIVSGQTLALVCALGLLVAGGVLDDMHDLPANSKFFVQLVAALLMTSWAGIFVVQLGDLLGLGTLHLYNWAIPFSVVCALGVANAINMVDGIDGAAGGVALVATLWLALAAGLQGLGTQLLLLLLLACAIAGFLAWNLRVPGRPRARAFMGDAGSMMLGIALCWFSIDLSQGEGRTLPPILFVWILAVPLLDMGRVMFARFLRGESMLEADREHLHHLLLDRGWSVSATALTLIGCSALAGAVGFAAWRLRVPDYAMFYAFVALLALACGATHRRARR